MPQTSPSRELIPFAFRGLAGTRCTRCGVLSRPGGSRSIAPGPKSKGTGVFLAEENDSRPLIRPLGRFREAAAADLQAIHQARQACDQAKKASPSVQRDLLMDLVHDHQGLAEALRMLNQPAEALRSLRAACDLLEKYQDLHPDEMEKVTVQSPAWPSNCGAGRPAR